MRIVGEGRIAVATRSQCFDTNLERNSCWIREVSSCDTSICLISLRLLFEENFLSLHILFLKFPLKFSLSLCQLEGTFELGPLTILSSTMTNFTLLSVSVITMTAIFSFILIDRSTAMIPEPKAPNFQYFERPRYRYPYYDENGKGKLLYGYGGPELYQYKTFSLLEGIY